MDNSFDVIIIGAGVTGCAVARELSRYDCSVLVIEKDEDVCCGTSKANSGIVHAGYDAKPGTLKAKMNIRGNEMMTSLCEELDIPFKRIGSLVVCTDESLRSGIEELYARGITNGVPDLKILESDEVRELEPNISDDVVCALYAPTAGVICPFRLNIALAECAAQNGVEFKFDTQVTNIRSDGDQWIIETSDKTYNARAVINAAGCHADDIHNLVSENKLHITPRRGDYMLLDRSLEGFVKHVIFPQPTKMGKGILVTPTVHGNTLVGPTAVDIESKDEAPVTAEGLVKVQEGAVRNVKGLPLKQVITGFSGLRAHEDGGEFILEEAEGCPGFFDCAGIESPGLTASVPIARMVRDIVGEKLELIEKDDFVPTRKGRIRFRDLPESEQMELIKADPEFGEIICRCQKVTKREIREAIENPLGARSISAIKYRAWATTGRCNGGYCLTRIVDMLVNEYGMKPEEITFRSTGSEMFSGEVK